MSGTERTEGNMNNTEYEKALTDAHGDADAMLGACL